MVWALVSIWAALNAVRIASGALPSQHSSTLTFALILLALVNLVFALYVVISPTSVFRF
jgi:hypothetical protein